MTNGDSDSTQVEVRGGPYMARIVPEEKSPGQSFRLVSLLLVLMVVTLLGALTWSFWKNRGIPISIDFASPHQLEPGASLVVNEVTVEE